MTASEQGVYLSVLEHKLSEIERNASEFRAILRHYLDRTGSVGSVEGYESTRGTQEESSGDAEETDFYITDPAESCVT